MRVFWFLPALFFLGCSGKPSASSSAKPTPVNTQAALASVDQTSASAPAASHLAHFADDLVSFEYPDVWIPASKAPQYLGTQVQSPPFATRFASAFSPRGNLYEQTTLLGLSFSYFARDAASQAECFASIPANGAKASEATYNGRTFRELSGSDAAMCHQQASQIDVTFAAGKCIAFERDFNTECFGAGDNKRKLTPPETAALQRHLDAVMSSVAVKPYGK